MYFHSNYLKGIPVKGRRAHNRGRARFEPPNRAHYLGPAKQGELECRIKDLISQGFILPISPTYGALVMFVPKKDGIWRKCVDYRALNKQAVKDRFPLPRIDSLLDKLNAATVFSKLDLASGYHEIDVEEGSIEKTTFHTNIGYSEFIVVPFEICNSPANFQYMMKKVLVTNLTLSFLYMETAFLCSVCQWRNTGDTSVVH